MNRLPILIATTVAIATLMGGISACAPKPALDTKTEAGSHANAMSLALKESGGDWSKVSAENKKQLIQDYGSEELAQEALTKMASAKELGNPIETK